MCGCNNVLVLLTKILSEDFTRIFHVNDFNPFDIHFIKFI